MSARFHHSLVLSATALSALLSVAGCPPSNGGGEDDDDTTSSSTSGGAVSSSAGGASSGLASSGASSSGGTSGTIIREPDPYLPDNNKRDSDCDGISDEEEYSRTYAGDTHTNPHDPDSDHDGVLDGVELGATSIVTEDAANCGPFTGDVDPTTHTNPTAEDTDGDGIPDGKEDANHNGKVDDNEMNPGDRDSDGDGIPDGVEDANHDGTRQENETDGSKRDTDGDGIPDGIEDVNRDGIRQPTETDPRLADTDGDGLVDGDEDRNWNHIVDLGETNPLVPDADADADGIPNTRELELGYDPNDPDMDDDGLKDGEEDRNRNGVMDGSETNPRRKDSDCDGLMDGEEDMDHDGVVDDEETDPRVADTDGDLLLDGLERGETTPADTVYCTNVPVDADPTTRTDPLKSDTDDDGINDGIEDVNRDGQRQASETDPNNADTDGDGKKDGQEDLNDNHRVDVGETDPLRADTDSDGDGLPDYAETAYGTNPQVADSDADGLPDGAEDANRDGTRNLGETDALSKDSDCDGLADGEEDANHNGTVESTETNPMERDSDHDGITDGVELGRATNLQPDKCPFFVAAEQPPSLTDPLNADSDGDGIPDGAEDANQNGRKDEGELDPKDQTDATGVTQQVCTLDNLIALTMHNTPNPMPDIQLGMLSSFSHRQDILLNNAVVGEFVVDPSADTAVVVFAISRAPAVDEPDAAALAQKTVTALGGVGGGIRNPITQSLPCSGTSDCTWDGFPAVLGSYDLLYAGDAHDGANAVVGRLLPGATGLLTGTLGALGPFKLRMQFVRRSNNRAVILGALMPVSLFNNTSINTSFRLEDAVNGTSLAQVGDSTGVQCDLFETKPYPKADIMFVIDNSGSMGDDQGALDTAATTMLNQLQGALVDWRVARITTDADSPHDGQDVGTREFGDVNGTASPTAEVWPFIKPADTTPEAFQAVVPIVRTMMKPGIGGWAVEGTWEPLRWVLQTNPDSNTRFLPATAADAPEQPWKLRADARLAVLVVTDTGEQSNDVQRSPRGWTEGPNGTILRFLRGGYDPNRDNEPPIFLGGILTPLGVVAAGEEGATGNSPLLAQYHTTINALGGVVGSLQDVNNIAPVVTAFMTAVVGNASPYALSKAPISSSIKVAIEGQPNTGCDWNNIPRSRTHGFDYDGATRQITFYGNCRPSNAPGDLGKRMAVSYRYWIDNTDNPDGTPVGCNGECAPPLVCNPATNQCECPSSCGLTNGCAAPRVCDTNPQVCSCICPLDCGGSPPNPRLRCDPGTCQFTCPADCGGPSPGASFTCNPLSCQYECSACDPSTRPTVNSERYVCDVTTCQWTCPEDCGLPSPGPGYRCDRHACEYTCTADCGGQCSGLEQCDVTGCQCRCSPNITCATGYRYDTQACACVCDAAALSCPARQVADPQTCTCQCKPACGQAEEACPSATQCIQSLCSCESMEG